MPFNSLLSPDLVKALPLALVFMEKKSRQSGLVLSKPVVCFLVSYYSLSLDHLHTDYVSLNCKTSFKFNLVAYILF